MKKHQHTYRCKHAHIAQLNKEQKTDDEQKWSNYKIMFEKNTRKSQMFFVYAS